MFFYDVPVFVVLEQTKLLDAKFKYLIIYQLEQAFCKFCWRKTCPLLAPTNFKEA